MFKGYLNVLQKAPFRLAKWPISGDEKHHIAPWNRLNRTAKWALSERNINIFGLCYRVYENTLWSETALITWILTFLHISFEKIFCQNKIKKNSKYVSQFSFKNAGIRHKKKREKVWVWLIVMVYRSWQCRFIILWYPFITEWWPCCHGWYQPISSESFPTICVTSLMNRYTLHLCWAGGFHEIYAIPWIKSISIRWILPYQAVYVAASSCQYSGRWNRALVWIL